MSKRKPFGLVFGALAPPLSEQLIGRVKTLPGNILLGRWQDFADAITLLSIHEALSQAEVHRARQRLAKRIWKGVLAVPDAKGGD